MEDLAVFLLYVSGLSITVLVCGFVADYILPHIPFVERWLESLPMWDDEYDD